MSMNIRVGRTLPAQVKYLPKRPPYHDKAFDRMIRSMPVHAFREMCSSVVETSPISEDII